MSRINNKVSQPKPQPKPTRSSANQTQKAGQESFASRFQKKDSKKKVGSDAPRPSTPGQTSGKGTSPKTLTSSDDSPATLMMQRHGAVLGRRGGGGGTVADLQAKLEGKGTGGKLEGSDSTGGLTGSDASSLGTDEAKGQTGLIDTDNLKSDMDAGTMSLNNDAAGAAGSQISGQMHGNLDVSSTVQIKGDRIPVAMMEKIVDQARVGVNEAGAPEFQFDLKGDVLGGLKMRISMEDGALKAIFVAENPEVKKLVDGNLKDLMKNLEASGVNIQELEVRDPKEDERKRKKEQNQKDREEAMNQ